MEEKQYNKVLNEYRGRLEEKGLPVIYGGTHLANLLGFTGETVAKMVSSTSHFYRSFTIAKRSGDDREIQAPQPSLLEIQRWIYTELLSKLQVNDVAHGYIVGRSAISNARPHCGRDVLLKLDLRDFFPSISFARVLGFFSALGYSNTVSYMLGRLTTLNGFLPQGAATSPVISNLLCFSLDRRLAGFARKLGLVYTRYADDMAFSGLHIPVRSIERIYDIVCDEGFEPNTEKTRLVRGHRKKVVTGVSVVMSEPKLPRTTKRAWRAEVDSFIRLGLEEHCEKHGHSPLIYESQLRGRLSHWLNIEKGSEYPMKMLERMKALDQSGE